MERVLCKLMILVRLLKITQFCLHTRDYYYTFCITPDFSKDRDDRCFIFLIFGNYPCAQVSSRLECLWSNSLIYNVSNVSLQRRIAANAFCGTCNSNFTVKCFTCDYTVLNRDVLIHGYHQLFL